MSAEAQLVSNLLNKKQNPHRHNHYHTDTTRKTFSETQSLSYWHNQKHIIKDTIITILIQPETCLRDIITIILTQPDTCSQRHNHTDTTRNVSSETQSLSHWYNQKCRLRDTNWYNQKHILRDSITTILIQSETCPERHNHYHTDTARNISSET